MNNVEVQYRLKLADGRFSETKKFRTAIITNSNQSDSIKNKEYFKGLIADMEKVERKLVDVKGYKEFR